MSTNVTLQKVQEENQLFRDSYSKGIINADISSLNKYKEARNNLSKIKVIESEQNSLKNEVSEIKSLLYKLLEQTSK